MEDKKTYSKRMLETAGFSDDAFDKAEKTCSNTQLYKQAGNSITVNVLEAIFTNMERYL